MQTIFKYVIKELESDKTEMLSIPLQKTRIFGKDLKEVFPNDFGIDDQNYYITDVIVEDKETFEDWMLDVSIFKINQML